MLLRVYRHERLPVALAAAVTCLLETADALVANCADTLYLSRRGASGLGVQLALSSALLVVTLAAVGALADRWPRARLLTRVAAFAAVTLLGLRLGLRLMPGVAPAALVVVGKQLASGAELAFWVLILDCFDARQTRRIVPLLMAAGGAGLVGGSLATRPLVSLFSVEDLLVGGTLAYAAASGLVVVLAGAVRPAAVAAPAPDSLLAAARDGARAAVRVELSRRMLFIVALAGAFAPVVYTGLGAAAAAAYPAEADLASFYGHFRGLTSLVALVAQLFLAPSLVAALGVGSSFLVAPLVGAVAGVALAARGTLAAAALAQAAARVADAALQGTAEKLAQGLLPRETRGRITSFLDGIAKRGGALAGGLMVTAVATRLTGIGVLAAVLALGWLVAALLLRRRYPALAVAALATRRVADPEGAALPLDEATLRLLRRDLAGDDEGRRELALEALGRAPSPAAVALLVEAAQATPAARGRLLRALERAPAGPAPPGVARQLLALLDETQEEGERAAIVQAIGRLSGDNYFAAARPRFEALAREAQSPAIRLAATAALARRDGGPREELDRALADALALSAEARAAAAMALLRGEPGADPILRAVAVAELRAEALSVPAREAPGKLLAQLAGVGSLEERVLALRTLAGAAASSRALILHAASEALGEPSLRPAALAALGALGDAALAPLFVRLLGDADDEVRDAAAAALERLGRAALPVLLVAGRFGARPVRQAALEILRRVESLPAACDDLVDAELRALWGATLRLAAIAASPLAGAPAGALLVRRLEERLGEIGRTLLVAVELLAGDVRVGQAARRLHDRRGRARALEALDALLPRAVARRVVPALDDVPLEERAARAREALAIDTPPLEDALRAELGGDDGLARLLVVHALGRAERAALRDAILEAAEASADRLDPLALLRRVHDLGHNDDVPRSIETMLALREVPLFSELGPGQLAEIAAVAIWENLAEGESLDSGEGLALCVSGRLRLGEGGADLGPGQAAGVEALFGTVTAAGASAVATEKSRVLRILREDFQRVVEDTPAIALALCRALIVRQKVP